MARTSEETIRVWADDQDVVATRGALPSLRELGATVHDVRAELIEKNLALLMNQVQSMFFTAAAGLDSIEVKEIKVAVSVDSSGEISLLGLTKAGVDLKATFEITLIPKAAKHDG